MDLDGKYLILVIVIVLAIVIIWIIWNRERKIIQTVKARECEYYRTEASMTNPGVGLLLASNSSEKMANWLHTIIGAYERNTVLAAIKQHPTGFKYEIYFAANWRDWYQKFPMLPINRAKSAFSPPPIADRVSMISIDIDENVLATGIINTLNLYSHEEHDMLVEYTYFQDGTLSLRGKNMLVVDRSLVQRDKLGDVCDILGMKDQTANITQFLKNQPYDGNRIDINNKGDYFGTYIVGLSKESTLQFAQDYDYESDVITYIREKLPANAWVEIGFYITKNDPSLTPARSALYVSM